MKTAREIALLALCEVEKNDAYSNIALKKILDNQITDPRDRALASAIFYGVMSRKRTLDYMIEKLSKIKLKKLSLYILIILRIGLFQMKFMEKIPTSAAVNESVKLAKKYGHSASARYVNGVLRTASKTEFDKNISPCIKYSFGEYACEKLKKSYPDSYEKIMKALLEEPKLTVRVNSLKITKDELMKKIDAKNCPISFDGLYIKGVDISSSTEYKEGLFTVQDAAPMAVCNALSPKSGEFIIDMCAAPGGKTTYLAELMKNQGTILAFDLHEHRVELIDKNAKRLGIDIIKSSVCDATVLNKELIGKADKVLCDVPCSGIGIAKRKPEIKYKKDFELLTPIQYAILNNASKYLKVGGRLVYSTCTLYKEENEEVVKEFLKNNKNFTLVSMQEFLPDGFAEDEEGIMTVLPHRIDCDGFFAAMIERCQ